MRVLYGYNKKSIKKPFVIIYQRFWNVGTPDRCKNHCILGEREVTSREESDIIAKMNYENRVYTYSTVEELIDDELRYLVLTPQIVQNNLKIYEASCKC